MILDYYVFAAYVFLLACVGIWLLGRVLKKSKKANTEQHTSYEKEQKLFNLYQNVEDMLSSFEEYVEEAKEETSKSMAKIQRMMEETRSLAMQLKAMQSSAQISTKDPAASENPQKVSLKEDAVRQAEITESIHIIKPTPVQSQSALALKTAEKKISKTGNKVAELYARGMTQNEIARRLGISVREVILALKIANAEEVQ